MLFRSVGPRCRWEHRKQVANLERGELSGDRRECWTSIDTLKATQSTTVRCVGQGHEWSKCENTVKVFRGKPEGVKTQEGIEQQHGAPPILQATDRQSERNPEGEGRLAALTTRGDGLLKSTPTGWRGKPLKCNLGRGCGMKQARKDRGGVNRREHEKC